MKALASATDGLAPGARGWPRGQAAGYGAAARAGRGQDEAGAMSGPGMSDLGMNGAGGQGRSDLGMNGAGGQVERGAWREDREPCYL